MVCSILFATNPVGGDTTLTILEDSTLTFAENDFPFSDVDGDLFNGIQVVSVETSGDLEYNGLDVIEGDVIADITQLVFIPDPNENGSPYATFTHRVIDSSGDTSDVSYTTTVNVTAVNDVPSFTVGTDETILEDGGLQTVTNWATSISTGPSDESDQALTFNITGVNTSLFTVDPSVTSAGELTYTPADDAHGSDTITVTLSDNGGTANDGVDTSDPQMFTITINPVADTPSITGTTTLEDTQSDTGLVISRNAVDGVEVTHFKITDITSGSLYQTDGTTQINNSDFITYDQGNAGLKFSPGADFNGTASFNLQSSLSSVDGGLGGDEVTASITVTAVNDVPSFTVGTDETILEDGGLQTVTNWATSISTGPSDESDQALTFNITGVNTSLFTVDPSVTSAGELTYTPADDAHGSDTITVTLSDNGGTANDGVDTSDPQMFTITINPVADTPSITGTTTLEDTQSDTGLVISRNAVDGVEVTHFKITDITSGSLYQTDGTTQINNSDFITYDQGNAGLKFSPGADFNGTASFNLQSSLSSVDGGLGGDEVTASITVTAVNDAPIASGSASLLAINEDNISSAGSTVSDLFAGNFDDSTDSVEDGSSANILAGIAIKINNSTSIEGVWQYSDDTGNNWFDLPDVSSNNAFLLSDASLLRFNPSSDWNGFPGNLVVHLIDNSSGPVNNFSTVDISTNIGDTTQYSFLSVFLETVVNPVNDSPEITYYFPGQDTLIYSNIDGDAQAEAVVYIYDFDSDNLTFQWIEEGNLINEISLTIPENDTLKVNFNFDFVYGFHLAVLTVTDDGEYHDTESNLFDETQQFVSDSTLFKIGQPSISTSSNQVFIINDIDRYFLPILIENGSVDSTINISNGLSLCLPIHSTIKWAKSSLINVDPTKLTFNSISDDSTQLLFNVESDFSPFESVEISGLKVTGFIDTMSFTQLRIIADGRTEYDSANAQDSFGFWVGAPEIHINPDQNENNYLIVDSMNPEGVWHSKIVLGNGPIDSTFHKGDTLRILIPSGLNMNWTGEPTVYNTELFSFVGISNNTLILKIIDNFSSGRDDTLEVAFNSLESSGFHSLYLDVVGTDAGGIGPTFPDSTSDKVTIGNPILASDTSQVFVVGDNPQILAPIRYMEDGISPTLRGHHHIYLKIPTEMNVHWSSSMSVESINVTNQNNQQINIDNLTLIDSLRLYIGLNIEAGWEEHNTLIIKNLLVDGFNNPTTGPFYIQCSVLNDSIYHDQDSASIQIGRPKLVLTQNNTFLYNDIPRPLQDIIIYEDTLVTTITKEKGILIVLPDSFSGQWIIPDLLNTDGSSYDGNIDSLEIISNNTLRIFLSHDFDSQDSLIIHNLMVGEFNNTSYEEDNLKLSVNGETTNFPHYSSDTTRWLKIGKPDIEMNSGLNILIGNDNSVLLPKITISEDSFAPVISINKDYIVLFLPETAGIQWDTSVPIVQLSGYAANSVSPIPIYNGNMVKFEIQESFIASSSISIEGLYLMPPTSLVDSAFISLSLNNGLTDCDNTNNKIRIGTLTFSSLANQFFFKNSDDLKLNNIAITQDTLVSLIDSMIVLTIPDSLIAIWDSFSINTNIEVYVNGDTINSIPHPDIQFSNSFKKLYLVSPLLDRAENILITNLYFSGVNSPVLNTSSDGFLMLMLDDLTYNFVLIDSYKKLIGGPTIYSLGHSSFILGEEGEFAKIDTILIKEDESILVLPVFDSLKIIIPDDVPNFYWDTTSTINFGSTPIFVEYQQANKIASILLDPPDSMGVGDVIKLWGLGFNTITNPDTGFHLEFQFVKDGTIPTILDTAKISSGSLSIKLGENVNYSIGTSLDYVLPDITIGEHSSNLLGKKRAIVLSLSNELMSIANWQFGNQINNDEVDSISIIDDTLKVFFNNELTNDALILSGMKLTTSEIFNGTVHADSLINKFSIKSGMVEISTIKTLGGYNPNIVDTTKNTIEFYPPVILTKPQIFNQTDTTIISFFTSPGMFNQDSVFSPSLFQIVRTQGFTFDKDTTLFSESSQSIVNIEKNDWILNDTLSVIDMPVVNLLLSDYDLIKLNRWFDELHYYNQKFDHFISIDKNNLPFNQNSDMVVRATDSSRIDWLFYNPELITFNKKERIISNDERNDFTLNLGDISVDSIQVELLGNMTNVELDTTFILTDTTFSFSQFSDLKDDLYTLRLSSHNANGRGLVPIIREFIVDNKRPQLVDILPRAGESKYGGGHEISKIDNIKLTYLDSLYVEKNLSDYSVQFYENGPVLSTVFPFPDLLELFIKLDWSEDLSYNNTDLDTFYIDRTRGNFPNWSMQMDSLLFSLVEDDSLIAGLERLNARIIFTLSDYTLNTISDSVEYTIIIDDSKIIGSEVFNYPNPFSVVEGKTNIRYVINKEGLNSGKFIVFDAGGDIVHYNPNIDVNIGTHDDLTWDGTNLKGIKLASGIYFGFLEIENEKPVSIKIAIINR
ncbi:MAG: hypothetical protein H8E71_06815 [Candidatus Marinimicrobia bacterium]|nr:hypothetical protein [Candidatus Neomarinimicrobiota bacterium]